MARHSRDAFIAHHRGSQHGWRLHRSLAKHWVLRNRRGMQPHRYGNRSRSGAGGAGARLDWLCGRWALHSQRLLVLQQKMLDTGVFCLVYLGLLNRRTTRTQSPKSQSGFRERNRNRLANTLPTVQCAPRSVIQHNCLSQNRDDLQVRSQTVILPIHPCPVTAETPCGTRVYTRLPSNQCAKAISAVTGIYVDCRRSSLRFFVLSVMAD